MTPDDEPTSTGDFGPDAGYVSRRLTVPNVLSAGRIVGAGVLLWPAWTGKPAWFIGIFVALLLTDWLDGKIAVLFHQRTLLGARLDSVADAILDGCLVLGIAWLRPEFVRSETILIGAMLGTYALSVIVALARFRRLPAYHTRAAKASWWIVAVGAVTLVAGGPEWPARIALMCAIIANVEAVAISFVLAEPRADVSSFLRAIRLSGKE